MIKPLTYDNMERLEPLKPVHRIPYVTNCCQGKHVLDLGSYDETAVVLKKNTNYWLFGNLIKVAKSLVGIDIAVPTDTIKIGSAIIKRADVAVIRGHEYPQTELITAGEILEHVDSPLQFLKHLRTEFPTATLIVTTPNALNFSNTLMGIWKREVQHPDHLQLFSYKCLHTLFRRAGYSSIQVVPYYFVATEMKLKSKSAVKRNFVSMVEACIRAFEYCFPLLAMGNIVIAKP